MYSGIGAGWSIEVKLASHEQIECRLTSFQAQVLTSQDGRRLEVRKWEIIDSNEIRYEGKNWQTYRLDSYLGYQASYQASCNIFKELTAFLDPFKPTTIYGRLVRRFQWHCKWNKLGIWRKPGFSRQPSSYWWDWKISFTWACSWAFTWASTWACICSLISSLDYIPISWSK